MLAFFTDPGVRHTDWGGAAFAVLLPELKNSLFFLFLGGMILGFLVSWFTGFFLEKIFHKKWWDYSRKKFFRLQSIAV